MIRKLLCKLGWHDWAYYTGEFLSGITKIKHPRNNNYRQCIKCCKTQRNASALEFYCDRKDVEWVTVKDLKQIK